ncbi:MAG: aminotransferase class IV, partial [Myxococcota bacterium]|nr:aminotransferase class IV [Myxococcota bacterium]
MTGRAVMIDGVLLSPENAKVSVYDRGFLFGDAVFEVLRTYGRKPFALEEHLSRLRRSAQSVFIELPVDEPTLNSEVLAALTAVGDTDGDSYVRIVVTRGIGPLTLDPHTAGCPARVILVEPVAPPPRAAYVSGIAVVLVPTRRAVEDTSAAGAKVTNYLPNLLALREAKGRAAQEALIVDVAGHVVEGATSNVFLVSAGVLCTPPVHAGILAGITRASILAAAADLRIPTAERTLLPEDIYAADEVFVTSSIREVLPVVLADGRAIGGGVPGHLTRAVHRRFLERLARELGQPVRAAPFDLG